MEEIKAQVWFNEKLWDVEDVISPTRLDHYILVKRKRKDQVHFQTDINPVEMALIDINNNQYYPNTIEVQKIMKVRQASLSAREEMDKILQNIWLKAVKEVPNNLDVKV